MQCKDKMYSIERATSAGGRHGIWMEEKVYGKRTVTSAVHREKVCSNRIKLCSAMRECTISEGLHLQ